MKRVECRAEWMLCEEENLSGRTLQVDQNRRIRTFQDVEVEQDGFLTEGDKNKPENKVP